MKLKNAWSILRESASEWIDDNATRLSRSICCSRRERFAECGSPGGRLYFFASFVSFASFACSPNLLRNSVIRVNSADGVSGETTSTL
jgi:hypothetical protein